jgi:hypothetical protein
LPEYLCTTFDVFSFFVTLTNSCAVVSKLLRRSDTICQLHPREEYILFSIVVPSLQHSIKSKGQNQRIQLLDAVFCQIQRRGVRAKKGKKQ